MSKTKKTKLLIITNTLETFGGGEKFTMETAKMLEKELDISIINPISPNDIKRRELEDIEIEYQGIYKIIDIPCNSRQQGNFLLMLPKPTGLFRLAEAIRKTDVIYNISMNPILLASAIFYSKLYRKRFILDLGNPYLMREGEKSAKAKLLQSVLLRFINEIHCQTVTQARVLKSYNYKGKVWDIKHPIWKRPDIKAYNPHKGFRCLYVSRLDIHQKGIDYLAKIIEKTILKNKHITFDIVGSGPGSKLLGPLGARFPKNVFIHGFVSEGKLERLYNESDLFVYTSRFETPGISLIEALSHGLPAVAFDVQGPKDVITNYIQGTLVPPFDIKEFVERIERVSKTKSEQWRSQISQITAKQYSRSKFKKNFLKMIS